MNAASIIPWIGGKRRLASHLLPLFPSHTCYVEAFAGAAALFFMKEPVRAEIINDVNGELVNLYRVIKHHLEEFVRQFRWTLVSREHFERLSSTPPATLTDVQRAAQFYYLQRLAFGGRVTGRTFGTATTAAPRVNLLRMEEDLSAAHLRLARATIEHMDWQECIRRYDRSHTLFYFDPPYWQTEGYGVPFELAQYRQLAEAMRGMKGKSVLSINDVPTMREVFAGLTMQRVRISYSVGREAATRYPRTELIVRNWR